MAIEGSAERWEVRRKREGRSRLCEFSHVDIDFLKTSAGLRSEPRDLPGDLLVHGFLLRVGFADACALPLITQSVCIRPCDSTTLESDTASMIPTILRKFRYQMMHG